MSFDFSGVKTNLEGINKYLESNGVKLSDEESKQLVSIFNEVDTSVHKEGEQGYKDGLLDFGEINEFKQKITSILPKISEKTNAFFAGIRDAFLNKGLSGMSEAKADATRVDNTDNITSVEKKEARPEVKSVDKKAMPITKKITAQSSVISDDTVYDEKLMNQALNNLIKKSNSKLKDKAVAFIRSAKRESLSNKLDPFILIAISMEESAHGASKASIQKNNVGGIMGKKGLRAFDSVESCVDSIAKTIDTRTKEGRRTISSIGYSGRYCDKKVAPQWITNVTRYAESLRQEYNKLLEQNDK